MVCGIQKKIFILQSNTMVEKDAHFTDRNYTQRDVFKTYLESHGLRKTPERFALLDRVLGIKGHFGVDDLYADMEAEGYHVSRATVYSTIELLCNCGILNRHLFGARVSKYEVALGSHFHLVCIRCGRIREIEAGDVNAAFKAVDYGDFTPTYFSTIVNGLCGDCLHEESKKISRK